jgi:hypothetical protein
VKARAIQLLGLATILSCSGTPSRHHVSFAHLGFEMPHDWERRESARRGIYAAIWTPEDNDRKESVTIIRTELAKATASAGSPTVDNVLATAVNGLPSAKTSIVVPILTRSGLHGVRVDVDYIPPGARELYHRVHAVLIDHDSGSLIHLLYTAKSPDERLDTFNLVLNTIHEGEG